MISADAEIDLHECRPHELRWKLLPFLDRGLTENWESVRVIHGIGEGVLKEKVWSILEDLEYVEEYHLASVYEGGRGVTIVSYAKDSPEAD